MNSTSTFIAGIALILLAAGCAWWTMSATPSASAVEAAKMPLVPVPTVNFLLLEDAAFADRVSYGTLPINIDGVGRDDPFAGTE